MIRINGELHEIAEPCTILPSGSPQICHAEHATHYVAEDGKLFPADAVISEVSLAEVADMISALAVLGVTE